MLHKKRRGEAPGAGLTGNILNGKRLEQGIHLTLPYPHTPGIGMAGDFF